MGDEDKQFEASQQKLEKARKEGRVPKSQDLVTSLITSSSVFAYEVILKVKTRINIVIINLLIFIFISPPR